MTYSTRECQATLRPTAGQALTFCALLALPCAALARGSHTTGHFGSWGGHSVGHIGGSSAFGRHSTPPFAPARGAGYSGYHLYYGYHGPYNPWGWRWGAHYGWGWRRPAYWPVYWYGGYWAPWWPVYDVWPFYPGRAVDPVVTTAVMMPPVESRYYYYHDAPAATEDTPAFADLTAMEPVLSGPGEPEYTVHREGRDPPLMVGSSTYPQGFTASIPSSLRFDVPGGPGTLHVRLGVMWRSGAGCSRDAGENIQAHFVILGDGKPLFTSGDHTPLDQAGEAVHVPVSGFKRIELRMESNSQEKLECVWAAIGEPEITQHP